MTTLPPEKDKHWTEKISRSGYFVGAVLLHLIVFVLVATIVIFPPFHPEQVSFGPVPPQKPSPVTAITPPHDPFIPPTNISDSAPRTPDVRVVIQGGDLNLGIHVPAINPGSVESNLPPGLRGNETAPVPAHNGMSDVRRHRILAFLEQSQNITLDQIRNTDPAHPKATFVVYLASYADGDWSCNHTLRDGKIEAGSLPNLIAKVGEWSHGDIKATVVPTPLNIGGNDLMDKKPPFIFFTGHRDFHLTDQEVLNLRDYLQMGGAIWGDNALAGQGSRFDVAFRREMKRVVPDKDKNFKPYSLDDDIFKGRFSISELPPGMNYYHEPIEHLDIDDRLAILYTPNDYSDMLAMRILPGDETMSDVVPDIKTTSPLFTNGTFYWNRKYFFRNFDLSKCLACDQLGMNIIGYFLTRFDNDLLLSTH